MDSVDGNCFEKQNHVNLHEHVDGIYRDIEDGIALPAGTTTNSTVSDKKTHYNMRHKERGRAIILNHMNFSSNDSRDGTNIDCRRLEKCLTALGFLVKVYKDLSTSDIIKKINKNLKHDHSNSDCFAMFVLTHGEQSRLLTKNGSYPTDLLWTPFTDESCPTLAGKPKLFFIQACQGDRFDKGIVLRRTETDGDPENVYEVPYHPDVLVALSSPPGFYSWRNPTSGSWFIQALCEELETSTKDFHLLELLTSVTRRVAIDHESYNKKNPEISGMKQTVCVHSTLTRLLHFNK